MSTLTSYTSGTRPTASSNSGLCIFRSDTNAIEVSDGTDWQTYNSDGIFQAFSSNSYSGYFDGADHITIGDITGLNGSSIMSFSCWFKFDGTPSSEGIIGGGTGASARFWVQVVNTTTIRFGTQSNINEYTVSTMSNGTWYHLACVMDGTTKSVYLDGNLAGSSTVTALSGDWADAVTIGRLPVPPFGSANYYAGYLDELALFDFALTSTEVNGIINNKLYPERIAFWRLENDFTDNEGSYNGTNSGVTFSTSDKPY